MKLTKKVIATLKNFANINPGIIIKEGSIIRTKSVEKNIFAQCETDVEFPREFCIFDLNEFLSTISIFNNPDLDFKEKYINISEGKSSVRYYYSSPTVVTGVTKMPTFPEGTVKFSITQDELQSLIRAANILSLDSLNIKNDETGISLSVTNSKNATDNTFSYHVDATEIEEFSDDVDIEHLKMIPSNYDVDVVPDALIHFRNDEEKLSYWIAVDV